MRKFIIFLMHLFLFTACSSMEQGSATSTNGFLTQTPAIAATATITPQPTHTATRIPSPGIAIPNTILPTQEIFFTATSTPTFVYPTRTPIVPTRVAGMEYELVDWTPELADQLIARLLSYPDGLDFRDRGYHEFGYFAAYQYASYAIEEALMLFPDSDFTDSWVWSMAYNMALYGDADVNQFYTNLISQAVQSYETDIEHLEAWFMEHEPRLNLWLTELPPPHEFPSSYLIEITDPHESTGIFIWAVGGPSYTFYSLPACDQCGIGGFSDFRFSSASGIGFILEDVSGDGIAEVLTEHIFFPGNADALTTNFDIFDVSQVPYQRIEFDPPLSYGRRRTWTVLPDNGAGPGMLFEFVFDSYSCPFITYQAEYRLQQGVFVLVDQISPDPEVLAIEDYECMDFYFSFLLHQIRSGDDYILDDVETWLANWPYSEMPSGLLNRDTQAPDDRDGMRFVIGLYLALNSESEEAIRQITHILTDPVIPSSHWIEIASIFLSNYLAPSDLPDACAATGVCYQLLGDRTLVEQFIDHDHSTNIIDFLVNSGMPILSTGTIYLNSDTCIDYWIVFDSSYSTEPEQALLLCWEGGYKLLQLFLDVIMDQTSRIEVLSSIDGFPVFSISGDSRRNVLYQEDDGESTYVRIREYEMYIRDKVDGALLGIQHDLFAGVPLVDVRDKLRLLEPLLIELEQMAPTNYLDPSVVRWYYLGGLTYELMGNTEMAVQAYLNAWEFYPNVPYGMMASARLQPVQQP